MTASAADVVVLGEDEWRARRAAHEERIDAWTAPRLARRSRGRTHPVDDFLFDYYPHRPAQLRRWHPGHGVALAGDAGEWLAYRHYVRVPDGITTSARALADRAGTVDRVADLLHRTRDRPPRWGCFGLHEWAMVYRLGPGDVRHSAWPLRLSPADIAEVVEAAPLRCTHFDAYRFYSPDAVPLNEIRLTREMQPETEQPGCLHATMDLYRWAYTLSPFVPSDLVADCFALAREVRAVDMRAAPYDLTDLGYQPIPIETAAGRAEFVALQRAMAGQGQALRDRLLAVVDEWRQPAATTRIHP